MFMRRKDKDSHPNGWTQEMLDIFVDKFSTTHSYGSLALLITQCVRKVEITRPEDREKYFLETATFFGCLYVVGHAKFAIQKAPYTA